MAEGTTVDFISLAEFQTRLKGHLDEAEFLLARLLIQFSSRPALGAFQDASASSAAYISRWRAQVERTRRLVVALQAAHDATAEILTKYRTTEELNQAKAEDLAARLVGVTVALGGENGVV
jgi:hypothetical protein